ncbi:MAG: AraC family transcriptional regulator [Lentisphaerae bacterium]|nr:AraC family transcriptional regulator [Lentisphaerota bacterium]MCP4101435.1 AraC family transcriptional regulator [Lentisphaerota bacterium]
MEWPFNKIMPLQQEVNTFFTGSGTDSFFRAGILAPPYIRKNLKNGCLKYFTLNVILSGNGLYTPENSPRYELTPGFVFSRAPNERFAISRDEDYFEFAFAAYPGFYTFCIETGLIGKERQAYNIPLNKSLIESLSNYIKTIRNAKPSSVHDVINGSVELLRNLSFFQAATPQDTNMRFRTTSAKLLRKAAGAPRQIPEIAEALGYNDTAAFSKLFKSIIGSSPARFRAKLTKQQ